MLYIYDIPRKHKLLDIVTVENDSYVVTKIYDNSDVKCKYQLAPAEDVLGALEIMQKRDQDIRRNGSGYFDPTAYKAIKHVDSEQRRFHKLLNAIFTLCELSDFRIEERIILKDKQTGKVWR